MILNIDTTINKRQEEAWKLLLDHTTMFLLFGGGTGGGKSYLGCQWIITMCEAFPGTRWFIGRDSLKDVLTSTYITFKEVSNDLGLKEGNHWEFNNKYNYIQFSNGSRVDFLDLRLRPRDPLYTFLGSLNFTGGFLEEAGNIPFEAFDALKSRIGRCLNEKYNIQGKILITCNPTKNWLYRVFYKPWKKDELPKGYKFIQSLYGDNPKTAKQYEEILSQISNKATIQRFKYGIWEYDDEDDALFDWDDLNDMFTNTIEVSSEKFMIGDLARFGKDNTEIGLFRGLNWFDKAKYNNQDLVTTSNLINILGQKNTISRSHMLFDENGVGGGVVDILKGCKGFISQASPIIVDGDKLKVQNPQEYKEKKELNNYENLRTQCVYLLAKKIKNHEICITSDFTEQEKDELIEELSAHKIVEGDKIGDLKVTPKDKIKDIIKRSPDKADVLIMRMYFELKKPENEKKVFTPKQGSGGYKSILQE